MCVCVWIAFRPIMLLGKHYLVPQATEDNSLCRWVVKENPTAAAVPQCGIGLLPRVSSGSPRRAGREGPAREAASWKRRKIKLKALFSFES